MSFYSFYRKGLDLEPIEIEVTLLPGVPAFHVTGLPDVATKESVMRIKAALRHQGFQLPKRDQVLFNLRPNHERKTSQGLDLAMAAAYLWETSQIPEFAGCVQHSSFGTVKDSRLFLYGELALDGQVTMPDDLDLLESMRPNDYLVTGEGDCALARGVVRDLRSLQSIEWREGQFNPPDLEVDRQFDHLSFCRSAADILAIIAAGEHNLFIAGPAGSGKTTFARILHTCLRVPTDSEWRRIEKIEKIAGRTVSSATSNCERLLKSRSRPFVSPHHSASEIAILGGGVPACAGEITRAQHGVLLLDEFLEFEPSVVESLREPIERHEITLLRKGVKVTFPADFLLVATTNLCPCGDFVPGDVRKCSYSQTRCRSFYQKLTGPLLDRFEAVCFTQQWTHQQDEDVAQVRERVREAQCFARKTRGQTIMNSRLELEALEAMVPPFVMNNMLPEIPPSRRRRLALLRVARTIADLDSSPDICTEHLHAAGQLTLRPFHEFRHAFI